MELTCIVCPRSCRISVEEVNGELHITGNSCPRGREHAANEYKCPMRMITTTVAIKGAALPRLPVISTGVVPKVKLMECLKELYTLNLSAPVKEGDVVVSNLCGTGVNIIAAKTMTAY